ncbi:hypothetical protein ABEB36_009407 [Hypothenemus hampei]|uniref:Uncharacterized protein n=1 Tax=Hypothenemus hampei TaxID=57062 RepID=A0ABD1EG94_HYPHA
MQSSGYIHGRSVFVCCSPVSLYQVFPISNNEGSEYIKGCVQCHVYSVWATDLDHDGGAMLAYPPLNTCTKMRVEESGPTCAQRPAFHSGSTNGSPAAEGLWDLVGNDVPYREFGLPSVISFLCMLRDICLVVERRDLDSCVRRIPGKLIIFYSFTTELGKSQLKRHSSDTHE